MPTNRPRKLKRCATCGKVWIGNIIYLLETDICVKVCRECKELLEGTGTTVFLRGRKLSGATI